MGITHCSIHSTLLFSHCMLALYFRACSNLWAAILLVHVLNLLQFRQVPTEWEDHYIVKCQMKHWQPSKKDAQAYGPATWLVWLIVVKFFKFVSRRFWGSQQQSWYEFSVMSVIQDWVMLMIEHVLRYVVSLSNYVLVRHVLSTCSELFMYSRLLISAKSKKLFTLNKIFYFATF